MKRSPTAPSRASKRTRPHPAEGPAPTRAPEAPPSDAPPPARDPPAPTGATPSHFYLRTPDGLRIWRIATRDALLDLDAAAREALRRPERRVLSRAEIRRMRKDALASATSLIDMADGALTTARWPEGGAHADE
jgi:hypothetical protein